MRRAIAVLVLGIAGCGPAGTQASRTADYNAGAEAKLRQRAAFDLKCPASQLRLTRVTLAPSGVVETNGVEGCGQRAAYVHDYYQGVWI
jgi:hypothetical protein